MSQVPTQTPIQSPIQVPLPGTPTQVGSAGGGPDAMRGANAIAPALGQLVDAIARLVDVLSAPGAPTSGGGGAAAAPTPPSASMPGSASKVDVADKARTTGLSTAARRGLDEAHRFGLPLVSGKRDGNGRSDHDHGNAIDVSTLPISADSSTGGTPKMREFAEFMRQQGAAGQLDVKYVIADGRIASAKDGWQWRPYTHPDQSAESLAKLKSSNRGEYNRLQHYDHVHVSFG